MVRQFRKPILRRSVWQLVNTLLPYVALWGVMIWALNVSYWITLALAVVSAGFLARIFIIFHDCAHGAFMTSPRANQVVGFLTGVLAFTPYGQWRHLHVLHHATSGDLDRRGMGDIWTLTVEEYMTASFWKRLSYRVARSPVVLFVAAPLYLFLVHHRIPSRKVARRDRGEVLLTNGVLLLIVLVMSRTIGVGSYLLIQLPVILCAGMLGVWLFYVQHQFDGVYWERSKYWDFETAALRGSSFYKLPRVLQWFTGNIGFHHVHHLCPGIPNYNLERCHEAVPLFRQIKPVTFLSSMKSLTYRLWDERQKRLVGFGQLRRLRGKRISGA